MRNQDQLEVRRQMLKLTIGDAVVIQIPGVEDGDLQSYIRTFAKAKGLLVTVAVTADGVSVTRNETIDRATLYPEIDRLAVGESHVFEIPPRLHQRIRQAATFRNRSGSVRLSCLTEAGGIRVVRLPIDDAERADHGPVSLAVRPKKWDLDGLADGKRLRFDIPPPHHHKLRLAATQKGKVTGWTIRCRIQDDGSMLVYRTDSGLAAGSQQAAE